MECHWLSQEVCCVELNDWTAAHRISAAVWFEGGMIGVGLLFPQYLCICHVFLSLQEQSYELFNKTVEEPGMLSRGTIYRISSYDAVMCGTPVAGGMLQKHTVIRNSS